MGRTPQGPWLVDGRCPETLLACRTTAKAIAAALGELEQLTGLHAGLRENAADAAGAKAIVAALGELKQLTSLHVDVESAAQGRGRGAGGWCKNGKEWKRRNISNIVLPAVELLVRHSFSYYTVLTSTGEYEAFAKNAIARTSAKAICSCGMFKLWLPRM